MKKEKHSVTCMKNNISPNDKVVEVTEVIYNEGGDTLQKLIETAFKIHLKTVGYSSYKGVDVNE